MTTALSTPVITRINQLTFGYPSFPLLHQLSLTIHAGITFIQGNESSGKTTLLKLLAGELTAQQGSIQFTSSTTINNNPIFWVDPSTDQYDQVVVKDYFNQLSHHYPQVNTDTLEQCIEAFSLTPHLDKQCFMLSTGTKRKVWIAAALASGAKLVLLDNPEAALDALSIRFIHQYLAQQLHQSEQAIVVTCYEIPNHLTEAQLVTLPDLAA